MSFWPKLRRLALACCVALFIAAVAALVGQDAPKNREPNHRSHTFVEN